MRSLLSAIVVSICLPHPAAATTVTFEGSTSLFQTFTSPYSEGGYTLTPTATVTANEMFFIDPALTVVDPFSSDYLEFDDFSQSSDGFTLTRNGGGLFDLVSVMVSNFGVPASFIGNFVFTGELFGGGSVSTTIIGSAPPYTVLFSGFTFLTSLTVTSTDSCCPAMDNIELREVTAPVAATVPEPATLSLLGLGLAGAAVRRRMKRR